MPSSTMPHAMVGWPCSSPAASERSSMTSPASPVNVSLPRILHIWQLSGNKNFCIGHRSFPGQMAAHLGSLLISELCAISASPSNGHLVRSMLPLQSIHPRQQKSVNDGHSKSLMFLMFCPPDLLSCPCTPMLGCCRNLAVALWSPDAIGRHEQRDFHGSPVLPSVLGKVSLVPCVPNLVLRFAVILNTLQLQRRHVQRHSLV